MAVRGVVVTYEAIREWRLKFGQTYAVDSTPGELSRDVPRQQRERRRAAVGEDQQREHVAAGRADLGGVGGLAHEADLPGGAVPEVDTLQIMFTHFQRARLLPLCGCEAGTTR